MTTEASQKLLSDSIWMEYFNKLLFEKGLITETEKNKMKLKIDNHFKEQKSK